MRPTLPDLAKAAGVSTATVDRVLNDRPGVSDRTRALVKDAAHRIGYLAHDPQSPRAVRLAILLPSGTNTFIEELRHHLTAAAATDPGVTLDFPEIPDPSPQAMTRALDAAAAADGIAVLARHHPMIHEAVQRLTLAAKPLVTLASDLPDTQRLAYVGIDDTRAGRLAGQVITRFLGHKPTGKVALFAGSLSYRGHHEREIGLRQILSEDAPDLTLLEVRESNEDRDRAYAEALELLRTEPDLVAIYNAGGGTQGIARALQETHRAQDTIFVAHEATVPNRALLLDGTLDAVIDQNARAEAFETIATLKAAARGQDHSFSPPALHLILRENLPTRIA